MQTVMSRTLPKIETTEAAKVAIRVLVVDDHDLVRQGLRYVFHNTEIEITAEASDEASVIRLVEEQPMDVVLLDIGWPEGKTTTPRGFDILRAIRSIKPELPVVIYSMHDRESYKSRCRDGGASGYVVKGTPNTTLVEAVRKAYEGENLWDEE